MNQPKTGFTIAAVLLLSACATETSVEDPQTDETVSVVSNDEEESERVNTVVQSQLTGREEIIVTTMSSQSLVFDFNADREFTEARVWIEKYEYGEPTEYAIGDFSMSIMDTGHIVFSMDENNSVTNEMLVRMGIGSRYESASYFTSDTLPEIESADEENGEGDLVTGMIWESSTSGDIDITNGEIILGSLIYSNMEQGIGTLTEEFYADVEGNIEDIEKYALVYLLKSEFLTEDTLSED